MLSSASKVAMFIFSLFVQHATETAKLKQRFNAVAHKCGYCFKLVN
jgi:hypothetical protein